LKNFYVCKAQEPKTIKAFASYDAADFVDGIGFLVNSEGNLRSMWRSDDKANGEDANSLKRRVVEFRIAPRVRRPAQMQGHHHH
jgi:hypothetical protein